jgi:Zn-dependent protease with chaperone function
VTDKASKILGAAWVALAAGLALLLAFGLAPLARAVPWKWEKKLAVLAPAPPACAAGAQAQDLLHGLVARLYPVLPEDGAFPLSVRVVKDPAVNAFATLGGNVFLNSGLLAKAGSAEEVAGVLAHEIEHVRRRHILQAALVHLATSQGVNMVLSGDGADLADFFLSVTFSRAQEEDADAGGLARLRAAHIDNRGFKKFFERMEREDKTPAFLSDHPASLDRAALVAEFPNGAVTPLMTDAEWAALKTYCR